MPLNIKERISSYIFLAKPIVFALRLIWEEFRRPGQAPGSIRDRAFARWFEELGNIFKKYEATTVVPRLVSTASGTVLDLGPATGNQLDRFSANAIDQIYGIEPNPAFIAPLKAKVAETPNLSGKYTICNCGIEDEDVLRTCGITKNSIDCIVSIQVLCCVADPAKAARQMWTLLKPGGELVFWEHHRNDDLVTSMVQSLYNIFWSFTVGNCSLTRRTKDTILQAGDWEIVELGRDGEPWDLMPRIWGRLRKVG